MEPLLSEQRKHKRFGVKDWVLGATMPRYNGLCKIIDVSSSGLAFYYVERLSAPKQVHRTTEFLMEVFEGHYPALLQVPCKLVYDIPVQEKGGETVAIRRCGVQFEGLSKTERAQLRYFIDNYVTGEI